MLDVFTSHQIKAELFKFFNVSICQLKVKMYIKLYSFIKSYLSQFRPNLT